MICTMRNWETCRSAAAAASSSHRRPRALSAPHPTRTLTPPHPGSAHPQRRSYQGARSASAVAMNCSGPELLLTPIREILTNRDDSPIRRVSLLQDSSSMPTPPEESIRAYSIPISDVMLVDSSTHHRTASDHRGSAGHRNYPNHPCQIFITTFSCGLLDFQCLNQNGHDILMAFLKASLAPERVLDGSGSCGRRDAGASDDASSDGRRQQFRRGGGAIPDAPALRSSSSVTSCLDVDAFTAAHLQGRADRETWPEKMTRRVGKVVNSLSELSGALCDLAWCLEGDQHHHRDDDEVGARDEPPTAALSPSQLPRRATPSPRRQHRPNSRIQAHRAHFHYSDLELDDQDSSIPTQASDPPKSQDQMDRRWNSLPHSRRLELSRKSSC